MAATVVGSIPSGSPPANASPDSFSSTRDQRGSSETPSDAGWVTGRLLRGRTAFWALGHESFASLPEDANRRGSESRSIHCPAVVLLTRSRWSRSGADLEPGEVGDLRTSLVQQRLHGALGLAHRRLLEEDDLLEEAVHPAIDDLGQRRLRLALGLRDGLGDGPLVRDDLRRHVITRDVLRAHRADLHGSAASSLRRGVAVTFEGHQDTDLRRQVGGPAVQVSGDLAVIDDDIAQLELLTDDGGERLDARLHGATVGKRLREQRLDACRADPRRVGDDLCGQLLELLVLGDEIGLASKLDHGALGGSDEPVLGVALAGPLDLLGDPLLAQLL